MTMMNEAQKIYRPEIAEPPWRIRRLPVDRGFPVPWFVSWIDGKPEFRATDGRKLVQAVEQKLCWVCGMELGRFVSFVIGPMCSVNRVSAEPPSHKECAEYSARNCPFLSKPQMVRREGEGEAFRDETTVAGVMIKRNPGCCAVWTCRDFQLIGDGRGGMLFRIGDPTQVEWFAEGKIAKLEQVQASIDSGLPLLEQQCHDGIDRAKLKSMTETAKRFLPRPELAIKP
jgi:hypothetical protein